MLHGMNSSFSHKRLLFSQIKGCSPIFILELTGLLKGLELFTEDAYGD